MSVKTNYYSVEKAKKYRTLCCNCTFTVVVAVDVKNTEIHIGTGLTGDW